jgi:hypothetical protein
MASITRYDADQIAAGDTIVIKEGKIRRFYHVCEVSISGDDVHIVYNNGRAGFAHLQMKADDPIRIRE